MPLSERERFQSNYRGLRALIDAGAVKYIEGPWRMERLINGVAPAPGQPIADWAKRALAAEKRKFRRGHWSADLNRLLGLLEVWRGAMQMRRAGA